MNFVEKIEENWLNINQSVQELCKLYNKDLPKIIAVTKTRSIEEIEAAYDIGIKDFGENYAQELENKALKLPDAKWHFIGHLQRSNAKKVIPYVKMIHSLDSEKIISRLSLLKYSGLNLIQVNISDETTKSGTLYDKKIIENLIHFGRQKNIKIDGLMAIGNPNWNNDETKLQFQKFVNFTHNLSLKEISLGMSDDWKNAVLAGSTILRLGTIIFGPRI